MVEFKALGKQPPRLAIIDGKEWLTTKRKGERREVSVEQASYANCKHFRTALFEAVIVAKAIKARVLNKLHDNPPARMAMKALFDDYIGALEKSAGVEEGAKTR